MLNLFKPARIDVPHFKNTINKKTERLTIKNNIHLAISSVSGSYEFMVAVGDNVNVGQVLAQNSTSGIIHASVSGIIEAIDASHIIIKPDCKQTIDPVIQPPIINSHEDFVNALKISGLIGAGFPAYVKFDGSSKGKINTLIINAAESEPFITSDIREVIENTTNVLDGTLAFAKNFDIANIIIGIQNINSEAIAVLKKAIAANSKYNNIRIKELTARYPQSVDKILIKSCLNKELDIGKTPINIGVAVVNVSLISFLGDFLKTGIPLVTRRITVDGGAVKTPKNIFAPIGTLVKDLVEFCGGYNSNYVKILSGGPMMGIPLVNDAVPISKKSNAIILLNKKQTHKAEEIECIRCARCIQACPVNILPVSIDQNVRLKNIRELKKLDLNACIGCGFCSFICPSNRALLPNIRIGRTMQT